MGNCATSSPRDHGELQVIPTKNNNNSTHYQSTFGEYTWKVRGYVLRKMKRANTTDQIPSPSFLIAGLSWRLVSYPNGKEGRDGSFDLFVQLLSLPPAWKHIECCIRIKCHDTKCSWTMYQQYTAGSSRGWTENTMLHQDIQSLHTMTFSVNIWIHKIVLNSNLSLFERRITSKHHQIQWTVDPEQLQLIKSAHDGFKIESEIFDEMWCLQIHKLGIITDTGNTAYFMVFLQSCALPKGVREYKVLWDMECILKGPKIDHQDDKRVYHSKCNAFSVMHRSRSNVAVIWEPDDLPLNEVQKCESLELNLTVVPSNASQAVDHWTRVAEAIANTDDSADEKDNVTPLLIPRSSQIEENPISPVNDQKDDVDISTPSTTIAMIQSMQSKIEGMQQQIMSLDQKIITIRSESTVNTINTHSDEQSDLLAQLEMIKKEMTELKEAQFNGNYIEATTDESEDSEQERLREWLESEVKLSEYYKVFKENGFDDLESAQQLKEGDLIAMGVDKTGHRRKILNHVHALKGKDKLKVRSLSEPSDVYIAALVLA